MRKTAVILLFILLVSLLTACEQKAPELTEDSFIVKVRFDTDIDVYTMLYAWGDASSGGVSYADGTRLNDVFYMTFDKATWGEMPLSDGFLLSIAPEIEGAAVDPVKIAAKYGNIYYVTVSGTGEAGYAIVQTEDGKKR